MSPLRTALFLESLLNILIGALLALAPTPTLSLLISPKTPTTPLTALLIQLLGVTSIALAVPLALAYPDTRQGRTLRVPAYVLLGTMEVGWIAVLVGSVVGEGEETGLSVRGVWVGVGWLAGLLAWRVYVVLLRPEWVGASGEDMEKKVA